MGGLVWFLFGVGFGAVGATVGWGVLAWRQEQRKLAEGRARKDDVRS